MPSAEACLLSAALQAGGDGLDSEAQPTLWALDPSLCVSEKGPLRLYLATLSSDTLVRMREGNLSHLATGVQAWKEVAVTS